MSLARHALPLVASLAAACGRDGPPVDRLDRLARELPATASAIVAIDGPALRGTWLARSAGAWHALVAADRGCVIDVALAAERAVMADVERGRVVAIATTQPFECRALSQVARGLWIATLDGAAAPDAKAPRLADRPDWPEVRARLAGPMAAVAPDGVWAANVVFAAAEVTDATHARLELQLDTTAHAEAAEAWLRDGLAAAGAALGEGGAPLVGAVTVARDATTVTATLATEAPIAERGGPIVVVATVGALAARRAAPVAARPGCEATQWTVTCTDGTRFGVSPSLRATIEDGVRTAEPVVRVVNGAPAGVRLGAVAQDGVLYALGLRAGDAVIAVDDRRLDSVEAIDEAAEKLRRARKFTLTVVRAGASFELAYAVE
jgi:hypothetical protein